MIQNNFRNPIYLALYCFAFVLLLSCEDNISPVGIEFQPESSKFKIIMDSTISIDAYTQLEDSIYYLRSGYILLGSKNVDSIGKTKAEFISQFIIPGNKFDTTTFKNVRIQSFKLIFTPITGVTIIGDTNSFHTVRVFRLKSNITCLDSTYQTSLNPSDVAYPVVLGEKFLQFRNSRFEIDISNDRVFMQELFDLYCQWSDSLQIKLPSDSTQYKYNVDSIMLDFFKGLRITVDQLNSGSSFLKSPVSNFQAILSFIHYAKKFNEDSTIYYEDDTTYIPFVASTYLGYYNYFTNSYKNPTIKNYLNSAHFRNEKVFLQGLNGLKVRIDIPNIGSITKQENITINQANLYIYNADDMGVTSLVPLIIKYVNDKNQEDYIPEYLSYNSSNSSYSNSAISYSSTTNSYTIRIPKFIQGLVNQKDTTCSFYLHLNNQHITPYTTILGSGTHSSKKMKLKIIYTKLK